MSATAAGTKKICCKCGHDVTGAPRMKDHEGQYWCMACGEADRLKQLHVAGGICTGCGESKGRAQLMDIAGQLLCPRCRKLKFGHGSGLPQSSSGGGLLSSIKSLFGR